MITQLDTENADRDLTSQVTVLTHTPSASAAMLCQALVNAGDGTKNLDGTGGDFQLEITVGGNSVQPGPQTITLGASDTRAAFISNVFPVPANAEVVVKLLSPNAADTDVDTTAYLYDVYPVNVASGVVEANAVQLSGDSTAADNLEAACDGGTYNVGGGAVVAASVTGAVGSVTGNVGGNVAGSVASVTGNVGGNVVGSVGSVTGHTAQTGDSYARLGAPAGASVSADIAAVKAETASILEDTGTTIPGLIAALNDLDATEVEAAVNAALVALHLDHLLAVTYDPASKPGAADALLNELVESDAGVARFTANALEQGPSASGGDATEAKQDAILASLDAAKGATFDTATDSLEAIRNRGDAAWLSGAGEGAITYEYTLTSSVDATPIDDALVEVFTEAAMTNKVAQGRTDAFGVVTFDLDAGTYYLRRSKSGWTFTNPDTEVVA